MPQGRYTVSDGEGTVVGSEDFRCAPGPMGWRYFAEIQTEDPEPHHETVDVAVDASWRVARVRIDTGSHDLLLETRGDSLVGFRDGVEVQIPFGSQTHLDYFTPATNAITCRRLTTTADVDVVYLAPVTLEATMVRQRYDRHGQEAVATPAGRFVATRWTYTSLDDGWTADLWTADDVVVKYETLFELASYEPGASGPRPID